MATTPAQRAAWDAYTALTGGLLPSLYTEDGESWPQVKTHLGEVVIRIRRYAAMWHLDGPMLVAATSSAIRLYRHRDRQALTALAHAMAYRLFALAAGLDRRAHPARPNPKAAWNRRFEPGSYPPGTPQRRNTRYREPPHQEKGR